MEIDQRSGAFFGDLPQRIAHHLVALAFHRSEYIAINATGVHAHQHVFTSSNLAEHQRQVHLRKDVARVNDGLEVAEFRAQASLGLAANEALGLQTVADEVGHRDHLEVVAPAEFAELRDAGHGAIVVHDFADDAAGPQSGQAGEIHHGFRLTGTYKDTA